MLNVLQLMCFAYFNIIYRVWEGLELRLYHPGTCDIDATEDVQRLCKLLGRQSLNINEVMFNRLLAASVVEKPVCIFIVLWFVH